MEKHYLLINKKLSGEINPAEEIELQHWIQESPENELLYRRMQEVWDKAQFRVRIKGQQATFEKISRRLDFEENITIDTELNSPDKWQRWYKIVAVIVFLLVFTGVIYLELNNHGSDQVNDHPEMIVKLSPAGQKTRINLPDGSVCWLNSESEIRFLSSFTDSVRIIYLKGEAYFKVQKDSFRPFKVYSPHLRVTAIGTIFNIKSFPEDNDEVVSLVEGAISVVCNDNTYSKVYPGEAVSYNKQSKTSDKIVINPIEAIAWKDGILIFNDETYKTIFEKLERWYGVKIIVVGTPPKRLKYRATFKNELLVNILESLRYGRNFDFKINDKNVTIIFNKTGKI